MKNESNVIFYYPLGDGAPSLVGRNIFLQLFNMRKSLPFDELSLYSHSKNIDYLKNKFEDINIYTEKDIFNVSSGLVHIPISPLLFPNSKLLLHLYAKMKNIPLIFNYHGDIRTEMAFDFKTNKNINLSYVPSYLFLPYILKSADQLIVHSYLFKNLVADSYGVTNSKVIPNAVDDYWFSSEYEQITLENGLKLFYHGRLSGEKGVDILIKAVHKYIHSENNFEIMCYILQGMVLKKDTLKNWYASWIYNKIFFY
ncbi:glycosyltransferase [Methanolobus sp. WCC1]|uniref:glycosyltransferase n=1 Tax=unclassified Methanolobus TaxID=2629569 RepID=UPI003252D95F